MEEKKQPRPMITLWKHTAKSGKIYFNGWLDIELPDDEVEEITKLKRIRMQAVVLKTVVPLRAPRVRPIGNVSIGTASVASSPKGAQQQLRINPFPSVPSPDVFCFGLMGLIIFGRLVYH